MMSIYEILDPPCQYILASFYFLKRLYTVIYRLNFIIGFKPFRFYICRFGLLLRQLFGLSMKKPFNFSGFPQTDSD